MNRSDAAKQLYNTRKLRSPEEVQRFEDALEILASINHPEVLSDLFLAFDDSTQQHEVMSGLVIAVERFPTRSYLYGLATHLPGMLSQAKEWVGILHYGILNSPETLTQYHNILQSLPMNKKKIIIDFLMEIDAEPEFKSRIQKLLEG